MPFGIIMSLVVCTVLYIVAVGGDDRHGALAASWARAEPMITALAAGRRLAEAAAALALHRRRSAR